MIYAVGREPLIHFALLGLLLFTVYRAVAPDDEEERLVVVTPAVVAGLRADHERRHGTPPTASEEEALVERFIEGEVLYREALALGLDRGDVIVRRRLVQKMEFLSERMATVEPPDDAQLQVYLEEHRESYALPARISFEHVFVATDRQADPIEAARVLLERLRDGAAPRSLGDPFLRGSTFQLLSQADTAAIFGTDFAAALPDLELGRWVGPLPSAYGQHLVRVGSREPAEVAALDSVRALVQRDWLAAQQTAAARDELRRLRQRYRIVWPTPAPSLP